MTMSASSPRQQERHSDLPCLEDLSDLSIPLTSKIDIPAYINKHFPTEAHLTENISPFLSRLDLAIAHLDNQLATIIGHHCHDTKDANSQNADTLSSLTALQDSLSSLSTSATAAEAHITQALAPATPIFTALENTTATATALEALTILDAAVLKLESAATSASLDIIAADHSIFNTISHSLSLLPAAPTASLRRLPQLRARAAVATETVRNTLLSNFRRQSDIVSLAGEIPQNKLDAAIANLHTSCLVAHAMGPDVRAELLGSFVRARKLAFRAAFEMDRAGFSGIEKRFAWLRKELRLNWAKLGGERVDRGWGKVFPDDWGAPRRVAEGIVRDIKEWTGRTLDAGADRDVAVMVSALRKTKEFEVELDRRFSAIGHNEMSFVGMISESFGPWMGAYVKQEDDHLRVVLSELLRDEKWVCEDGTVLRSATELFLVIKKSMHTCSTLDIRQPLFSLHRIFKKHLASYGTALVRHLPGIYGNALADSSNAKDYERKVERACAIINTGEYCSTTVEQLEESLKGTVQEVFTVDIDHGAEMEMFSKVSARGLQSLVALLNEDLEIDLRKFSEYDWASWEEVGDTSQYVDSIAIKLTKSSKNLSGLLSKPHFRFLLEKFADSFITRFRKHIYKCEQMNNFGAQQILLDVTTVKAMLLGLPASVRAPVPGTFVKYVNRELGKVEAMLKVILAPVNMSVDTYVALVSDGTAENFQRILEMRGLRRADTAPLVLEYSRRIGPSQRLHPSVKNILVPTSPSLVKSSGRLAEDGESSCGPSETIGNEEGDGSQGQNVAVDSMKNLLGRLGTSLKGAGIADRMNQVSSQFESTTDRFKKEAAARGFRFG